MIYRENPEESDNRQYYDYHLDRNGHNLENKQIKNGDIFDIGQTVNGVSTFLWFNNTWYYFNEERFSYLDEYEYDQDDLTNLILNDEFEQVTFIKNIFNNEQK